MNRSRIRPADVLRVGAAGLRYRRTRTLLSALGIAALVSVLGITRSSRSALLAEIDQVGTNMLTVANGQNLSGGEAELPAYATAMITRLPGVGAVAPTALLSHANVYRSDKIPPFDTGGLAARAVGQSLLSTLGGTIRQGSFLPGATGRFPVTVLGYQAAEFPGLSDLAGRPRVLIGGHWFAVAGILNPLPLTPRSTAPRSSGSVPPRGCSATTGTRARSTSAPTSCGRPTWPACSARRPTPWIPARWT